MGYNNQERSSIIDPNQSITSDNGIDVLIGALIRNNPKLIQSIDFIDRSLRQMNNGMSDFEKSKAKKIYEDYMFQTRGKEYAVENFSINADQRKHIKYVNSQDRSAFKKYIEIAARQVIFAWIRDEYRRTGNIDTKVTMMLASDYDDIIQGIDYIVIVEDTEKRTKYMYSVDLAVTRRLEYVYEKIAKDKKTPLEFLAHINLPSNFQMEKYIIAIPPDIMGAFITELIYFLEHGKYTDTYQKEGERTPSEFDIFKKIYTYINHTSLIKPSLQDIGKGIRERVGIVTNIPISQPFYEKRI